MNIAQLFVTLGIKGDEKAQKSLKGIKNSLGEIQTNALLVKAGLLGVFYGLEQLMNKSATTGNSLSQFATFTGKSAEELQRWQYAAQQVGVAGDEVTSSIKNVQAAMINMGQGGGAPSGMAMVANTVGFDQNKIRDTFYVMKQLQEFAKKVPSDVANDKLKSFGLSEGTINAMKRNAFNENTMKGAPIYSDSEIGKLQKVDVAWANLGQKISMAVGHLTAKEGLQMVKQITLLADEVIRLSTAFLNLLNNIKAFNALQDVFKGWTAIVQGMNNLLSGETKPGELSKGIGGALANDFTGEQGFFGGKPKLDADPRDIAALDRHRGGAAEFGHFISNMVKGKNTGTNFRDDEYEAQFRAKHGDGSKTPSNVTINQDLHFQHDGKDAKRTGDSAKKAVKDAYRQHPAQNFGG